MPRFGEKAGRWLVRAIDGAFPATIAAWAWRMGVGFGAGAEDGTGSRAKRWTDLAWVCRDRLHLRRWQQRFEADGLEPLLAEVSAGRSVVVATVHHDALRLLPWFLVTRDVRVGTAVRPVTTQSARFRGVERLAPVLVDAGTPRALVRFLESPSVLVVTIDVPDGRQASDAAGGFSPSTAAARLARIAGAKLFACVVKAGEDGRFGFACKAVEAPSDDEVTSAAWAFLTGQRPSSC